jgi:hypothetical protein
MYYKSNGADNYKEDFMLLDPNMSTAWKWTIYAIFAIMVIVLIMCIYRSYSSGGRRTGSVSMFY